MNAFRQAISQVAPRALGSGALLSTTTTRLPNTAAIRTFIVATSTTSNKLNPGLHKKLYGTKGVGGEISNYLDRNVKAVALPDKKDKEGSTTYPQRRATASTCRSMSTSATEAVSGEISNYLSRNVEAVVLPNKKDEEGCTYPPLILDGASGTGKTQQAFALVKEHKRIIYFLMSGKPKENVVKEQLVYQRMRDLTMDLMESGFARRVEAAINALREDGNYKAEDICSVEFLRDKVKKASDKPIDYNITEDNRWARKVKRRRGARTADSDWMNPLMDVVLWMCSKHLQWDEDGGLRVVPIKLGKNKNVRFEDLSRQLKDIILFVDEALPKSKLSAGDLPDQAAIDRLRFVRNLGRALTMRVVLAGTAATAANMIADVANATSRYDDGSGELPWIECQFLWKTMSEKDVTGAVFPNRSSPNDLERALISELARARPYLVHLFSRVINAPAFEGQHINSGSVLAALEEVGMKLQSAKRMSDESNLVYLMGVWLHRNHISPCAFRVKPPALVRGHFFEPCAVLDLEKNPACGLLMGRRSLTSGHLRVKIYRYLPRKANRIMWCASMEGADSEPRRGFCLDFSGIEFSLTACVQQCLAREPLLAVALSTQCDMAKEKFRKALSLLCQDTIQQRNVDSADWKLHEHILFAVLQLASNFQKLTGPRVDLRTFLQKIVDYLTNESFAQFVEEFSSELEKYTETGPVQSDAGLGTGENDLEIDDLASTHKMPWLVPACSLEALKKTVDGAPSLFDGDGIEIAGLVPGVRQATFDAAAYSWKKLALEPVVHESKDAGDESTDVVAQPEWFFEFKARANPYTIGAALGELEGKCLSQQGRLKSEPDELECHAMLIAVTGGHDTCCKIDYCDIGSQKYLRVALVVGLGSTLLK